MTEVSADSGVRLGASGDVDPGEGRAYAFGDKQIAVFRMSDGELRATGAVCPHRGGPLADGQFDLKKLVCPLHLNAFDFSTGECATAGVDPIEVYRVVERDGEILVWV